MRPVEHLYFHIPFCPQLCDYCSFYSEKGDASKTQRFLDAMVAEVREVATRVNLQPKTVFFGGGTPSALSVTQLDFLLGQLHDIIPSLPHTREWTLEMNPATVSLDKARLLRRHGVNRISMGVQAFDDHTLKMLNRVHDTAQVIKSFHILREAGFDNVNLDLMFAVPGQTLAAWEETLEKTLALKPDHLSCYCLTYEEDTVFWNKMKSGQFAPDDSVEATMFVRTREILAAHGFDQYEISNYALPGRECLHNLAYWHGAEFAGFGPSACGTLGHLRYQNVSNTDLYCDRVERHECLHEFSEELSPKTRLTERLMFGLRTREGVPLSDLPHFEETFRHHLADNLVVTDATHLRLTPRGRLFADEIAMAIL
ncbi:MAG: radical SAM family heme chaperone HemW [Verrucomicrobiae bacterium]|nr:radical SAM family heme chaperone HemW [Verrucomicrobiae bacterium]